MSTETIRSAEAGACVVPPEGEWLWFLGTLAKMKLVGEQTGGRFALWEGVMPHGAAPPLHSHPQDETFYLLEGEMTAWLVDESLLFEGGDGVKRTRDDSWLQSCGRRCTAGSVVFAPGGTPHTFRVESDTMRLLVVSTPAGIEDMVCGLAEPAKWPWLQPPPDGPRVPAERIDSVERATGMVRHGPAPPPA